MQLLLAPGLMWLLATAWIFLTNTTWSWKRNFMARSLGAQVLHWHKFYLIGERHSHNAVLHLRSSSQISLGGRNHDPLENSEIKALKKNWYGCSKPLVSSGYRAILVYSDASWWTLTMSICIINFDHRSAQKLSSNYTNMQTNPMLCQKCLKYQCCEIYWKHFLFRLFHI